MFAEVFRYPTQQEAVRIHLRLIVRDIDFVDKCGQRCVMAKRRVDAWVKEYDMLKMRRAQLTLEDLWMDYSVRLGQLIANIQVHTYLKQIALSQEEKLVHVETLVGLHDQYYIAHVEFINLRNSEGRPQRWDFPIRSSDDICVAHV
jgi:hypothetical protein